MACLQQQLYLLPHTRLACRNVQQQLCRKHRHSNRVVPRAGAADPDSTDEAGMRRASMGIVYSQQSAEVDDEIQFPCKVPLLPFTVEEVMLPGSVKTLHLFEARYLSLLDTVLAQPSSNQVFGHVIVEQQGDAFGDTAAAFPGAYKGDGFVFLMATLVRVVEVKKTFVGALVRIQAEARAEVTEVTQLLPYFEGVMVPLRDEPVQDIQLVSSQVEQLSQTVRDLQNLTQRFERSKQSASLQQAVYWVDRAVLIPASQTLSGSQQQVTATAAANHGSIDGSSDSRAASDAGSTAAPAEGFQHPDSLQRQAEKVQGQRQQQDVQDVAEKAARLSFAALQGVPQESAKDQLKLLRCCVKAMKTLDTSSRLTAVQNHMQNSLNTLAAKCALKSLNLG